jgi:hypothetical protein
MLVIPTLSCAISGQTPERFHFHQTPRWYDVSAAALDTDRCRRMGLIDFEGDGDLDMVRPVHDRLEFLVNDDGRFRLLISPNLVATHSFWPHDVDCGDFTQDGIADVAVVGGTAGSPSNGAMIIFAGNGAGGYTPGPVQQFPLLPPMTNLVVSDLDGDSAQDFLMWDEVNDTRVIVLNGTGSQSLVQLAGPVKDLAASDVDGDSRPDLLMVVSTTSSTDEIQFILNNGFGVFPGSPTVIDALSDAKRLAVLDANGDGNKDVATTEATMVLASPDVDIKLYLGNGAGFFVPALTSPLLNKGWPASDLEGADLNGDGFDDLVLCFDYLGRGLTVVALGQGTGMFQFKSCLSLHARDVEALALTGSGAMNLLTATGVVVPVAFDGTIGGAQIPSGLPAGAFTGQAILDFNRDGIDDVATLNPMNLQLRLHFMGSAGTPTSSLLIHQGTAPSDWGFPVAGDVDGDGWEDVIVASQGKFTSFRNLAGTAAGAPVMTTLSSSCTWSVEGLAVADLNGDGFSDVVRSNTGGSNTTVALSQANGLFSASCFASPGWPGPVTLADFTGDQVVDLCSHDSAASLFHVAVGLGNGTFGTSISTPVTGIHDHHAAGDVDGDGDADLVATTASGILVLLNDGLGSFTPGQSVATNRHVMVIGLRDMDRDGDLDVVGRTRSVLSSAALFENQGGIFVDAQPRWVVDSQSTTAAGALPVNALEGQLAFGDLNGDGLLDISVAGFNEDAALGLPLLLLNHSLLRSEGVATGGHMVTFDLQAPFQTSQPYIVLASSKGNFPGMQIGGTRLPLNHDPILWGLSLNGGYLFTQFNSSFSATGHAQSWMFLPPGFSPTPFDVDFAYLTLDPSSPTQALASNALRLRAH